MAGISEESDPIQQVIASLKNVNVSLDDINKTLAQKKEKYTTKEIPATSVQNAVPSDAKGAESSQAVTPTSIADTEAKESVETKTQSMDVMSEDSLKPIQTEEKKAAPALDLKPADTTFEPQEQQSTPIKELEQRIDKVVSQNNNIVSDNTAATADNMQPTPPAANLQTEQPASVSMTTETPNQLPVQNSTVAEADVANINTQPEVDKPATGRLEATIQNNISELSSNKTPEQKIPEIAEITDQNTGSTMQQDMQTQAAQPAAITPISSADNKNINVKNIFISEKNNVASDKQVNPIADSNAIQAESTSISSNISEEQPSSAATTPTNTTVAERSSEAATAKQQTNKFEAKQLPNQNAGSNKSFEIVEERPALPREAVKDNSLIMIEKHMSELNSNMNKLFTQLINQINNLNNTVLEIQKTLPELKSSSTGSSQQDQSGREYKPFSAGGGSLNEFRSSTSKLFSPSRSDMTPTI